MKSFLKYTFATILGLFIFCFIAGIIFIGVIAGMTASGSSTTVAKENSVFVLKLNGTIGERAQKCELFAEKLSELVEVPVKLWDERSTTVSAHYYLNQTNTRGKKRKAVVDAVAATIILESYLGFRKNSDLREC